MSNNDFSTRLRKLRLDKGLSQTELGKIVGIHYTHVGKYERGSSLPKTETIKKIAEALDVTIDYLIEGSTNEIATTKLDDKELLNLFKQVETLSDNDKMVVKQLLDAFLAKRKIQDIVNL